MASKYVVIETMGHEVAICFNELLPHSTFRNFHPVSAGFFSLRPQQNYHPTDDITVGVYGRSESLKLKTRLVDVQLIQQALLRE